MNIRTMPSLLLAFVLGACSDDSPVAGVVLPVITRVDVSTPAVVGTQLRVQVANLDALTRIQFRIDDTLIVEGESTSLGLATFEIDTRVVNAFGLGLQTVALRIGDGLVESDPFAFQIEFAETLPLTLNEGIDQSGFRNDLAIVSGNGFLEPAEGVVRAIFVGTFEGPDGRNSIEARIPATQVEVGDRTRGAIQLSTALGGIGEGEFVGTVRLESQLVTGALSTSDEQEVSVRFSPPTFFGLNPTDAHLESIVEVSGGGFLGALNASDTNEQTILRVAGTFTPDGGEAEPFNDQLILSWRSGNVLEWPISARPFRDERLVSELFGAGRGVLDAVFTPIVSAPGFGEVEGLGTRATLTLGPITQVVWLRFVPSFYQSLPLFGIAASAGTIEELIRARMESIYDGWNVEVRLDEPTDVTESGLTIVEISGPDPNGIGLFGYDNSPGKDVGNLRMGDLVGGRNAETQAGGFPGYGGVFIDGFLYFSESRNPGDRRGPDPDPLFDEIFESVLDTPATQADIIGASDRASDVDRAVRALASMIGETTAHELGHSFGLADPFGPGTVFHNRMDRPGCLMDSGSARPFGERTAQPGFEPTRICGDNAEYLDIILGD